jgi:SAM-dependent methyltransferase
LPPVDTYQISAKYYDGAYAAKQDLVDLPFYIELAKKSGGPVLEVACGTGRILLPIAREGIEIHGIDNSGAMLGFLEQHLLRQPQGVRGRVTLHRGDMRSFKLGHTFPLVTIPFRPMQHMHTVEDQLSALTSAAAHLDSNGILAFDVFYPKYDVLWVGIGQEFLELEWRDPADPETRVQRYFLKEAVDKIQQFFTCAFIYRSYRQGKLVQEEMETLKLSWYTYPQLRALFLLAGLEVVKEYGSFEKTPLDNTAEQMIFLLKKTSSR